MVSSTTGKIFSFAISLLIAVISLTTAAQAANAPATVSSQARYTPGFSGNPGKMVRDAAGNFYVADFWGKRIVKMGRDGGNVKYIPTAGRPSAVYPHRDGRLVVAMSAPQPYVAFYSQAGEELAQFGTPAEPYFRPVAITSDKSGNIYVLDSGDLSESDTVNNVPRVRVYDTAGAYKFAFGTKTLSYLTSTTGGSFKHPMGIAYEKASDRIVVVDTLNGRIQFFKPYDVVTTCDYDTATPLKTFGGVAGRTAPTLNATAKFYNPVDIAFEYNGSALNRMFVLERGHNEVAVVDGVTNYGYYRKAINLSTYPAIGKNLVQPTSLVFENKMTAGVAVPGGVIYVNNSASSAPADIFAMGVDGGTVNPSNATLTISTTIPETVTSASLPISGTVSPSSTVFCNVNNGTDQSAGTGWSTTLNLANGYNNIICKTTISDITTYATASTYFTGTLGSATVAITSPVPGAVTKNSTVVVSGTSSLSNATVSLANAQTTTVTTTTAADGSWSATVTLAEGNNVITPSVSKPGSAGSGTAVTVVKDTSAPSVAIAFLSDSKVTGSAVQNMDGIILDANLDTIEVNGETVPAAAKVTMSGNNTYFSMPVTIIRGSNTVTVKATDLAGNSSTVTRTVTLNPDLPAFAVALPAGNSYLSGDASAAANGTSDSSYTSVNACGSAVSPSAGSWSAAAFTLGAGLNGCEFTAAGAQSATEKRTIINGASYAKLAITSPAADMATKNASVTIQGSVAPSSPTPTISYDGGAAVSVSSYNPITGLFSHDLTLAGQGAHTVKVTADAATSAVRNIIYDTVAPEFTVQALSKSAPVAITGALEPSARISAITATLLGAPVAIPLSVVSYEPYDAGTNSVVWRANLAGYTYDAITFTAADPASNTYPVVHKGIVPTGDIDKDGTVRLADALSALRHVAGTQPLEDDLIIIDNPFNRADVGALVEDRAGRDGKIDITDAQLILKKAYGLLNY